MALKLNKTGPQGIAVNDAYVRVQEISFVGKNKIQFRVRSFVSVDAAIPFDDVGESCAVNLDATNPFAQAYDHLKTLPEFADAQDC
jgi:hypothetical protein